MASTQLHRDLGNDDQHPFAIVSETEPTGAAVKAAIGWLDTSSTPARIKACISVVGDTANWLTVPVAEDIAQQISDALADGNVVTCVLGADADGHLALFSGDGQHLGDSGLTVAELQAAIDHMTDADAHAAIRGVANGVATLDATGKVPAGQLPDGIGAVTSVNTETGAVVLGTDDIAEGITNLYYTEQRVDGRVTAGVGVHDGAGDAHGGVLGKFKTDAGDVAGYADGKFTQSLTVDGTNHIITLVGDTLTPGNSKYYGTNLSGERGWYDLPAGPGTPAAQNNFTAVIAPTVTDDGGAGYEVGSRWLNTTTGLMYTCHDATAGAAVWRLSGLFAKPLTPTRVPFVDDNGLLTDSTSIVANSGGRILVAGEALQGGFTAKQFSDTTGPANAFIRGRGTMQTPTAVINNDSLGYLGFTGYVDTDTLASTTRAFVQARAAGDWTPTSTPTLIEFSVTPSNSINPATSLTLNADGSISVTGNLILGGDPTSDLHAATKAYVDSVATGGYTEEQIQDIAGALLTDSNTVTIAYDDDSPLINAAVVTQLSVTSDAGGVKLVNDSATPGNSKYYGTNSSGTRGFFDLPAGGTGGSTTKWPVTSRTANATLTNTAYGTCQHMSGTSAVVLTLPTVTSGEEGSFITFVKNGTGKLTLQAPTGVVIMDSSTGGSLYNDSDAIASVTLMALTTTLWIITGAAGTWVTSYI